MTLYHKLKRHLIRNNYLSETEVSTLNLLDQSPDSLPIEMLYTHIPLDPQAILDSLSAILDLPLIHTLPKHYKVNNFSRIQEFSQGGFLICTTTAKKEGRPYFIISDITKIEAWNIKELQKKYKVALMAKSDFYNALEHQFRELNIQQSTRALNFLNPNGAAENVNYIAALLKYIGLIIVAMTLSTNILVATHYLIYICQTFFKTWLFLDSYLSKNRPTIDTTMLTNAAVSLPVYSILVPMYKEKHGVKAILHSLSTLNYPRDKLDIKFVVEEDDISSLEILNALQLPYHIEIVTVPYCEPRTKPKALNYAMQYVKGEYVTIYDVEDRPDNDQLLHALAAFRTLPQDFACIQAKLNFYNKYENLLTRLFSIEYSIWFDFLLPALDRASVPVPLGGNSNHFKVDAIRKVGLWDAYNVTEDADLGLRLFAHGYRTKVIDSYTLEESPTDISNWLNQRSRWIKGFVQTFLVYLKQTIKKDLTQSFKTLFYVVLFIGFSTYAYFFLPLHFLLGTQYGSQSNYFLATFSAYLTFIYLYCTSSVIIVRDTKHFSKLRFLDFIAFPIWPLYFLLHVVASYKALWSLVRAPFNWAKTTHNISQEENAKYFNV